LDLVVVLLLLLALLCLELCLLLELLLLLLLHLLLLLLLAGFLLTGSDQSSSCKSSLAGSGKDGRWLDGGSLYLLTLELGLTLLEALCSNCLLLLLLLPLLLTLLLLLLLLLLLKSSCFLLELCSLLVLLEAALSTRSPTLYELDGMVTVLEVFRKIENGAIPLALQDDLCWTGGEL